MIELPMTKRRLIGPAKRPNNVDPNPNVLTPDARNDVYQEKRASTYLQATLAICSREGRRKRMGGLKRNKMIIIFIFTDRKRTYHIWEQDDNYFIATEITKY